jgi:hypothetical protein
MPSPGRARGSSSSIGRVSIRPGVSVLSILRHLNYKPWFALAEFVDNAVQSYVGNRARLEALHGPSFKLHVRVDIESAPLSRIVVTDNAAGIAHADFPRAFRPAAIPPDRTGLSEFGMGMKSAACWFAPRWRVRTKALNEDVERLVQFDVERIVHDQLEELGIVESPASRTAHFTEIVMDQLHHVPMGRTVAKIKEHLTDIYREYLRQGTLKLKVAGDTLAYAEPPLLNAPYVRDAQDQARLWRKQISFDLGGGLSAAGFAGLMDPMNTGRSGFALFRRGRLIQGSGDEGYRPALIFGQPGNFRWRRLFGELHLEGFEVSHTKDGFRWDENEQPFLELLRDHLDSDDLPLLRQADNYRVQVSRAEAAEAAQRAMARASEAMQTTLPEVLPRVADEPLVETETTPLDPPQGALASRELRIDFRGQAWLIRIELNHDAAQGEWLAMSDQPATGADPQVVEIRVSMAHPFMVSFAQTDANNLEAMLRIAAGIALSEKLARSSGVRMAKTIRRNLNDLLREALSRP